MQTSCLLNVGRFLVVAASAILTGRLFNGKYLPVAATAFLASGFLMVGARL
jgi:hypothetical protein